jgi:hypothetical protein
LIYDEALYGLSVSHNVEFLPWRVWISLWTLAIGVLMAGFEGSIVVKHFTNFTKGAIQIILDNL